MTDMLADHLFGMVLALVCDDLRKPKSSGSWGVPPQQLLWPLLIGAVVADLTNKRKVVR